MQVGRDIIEIVCDNDEIKNKIVTNGVNNHGQLLLARSEMSIFVNVSLTAVPLEMPPEIIDMYMSKYGDIKGHFRVKRKIGGLVIYNGTRVYQFRNITKHIPHFISILNKKVRVIYTGQPERPAKVDIIHKKYLINAGKDLPEPQINEPSGSEIKNKITTPEVNWQQETERSPPVADSQKEPKEKNQETASAVVVESQEIEKSPPVVNSTRKRHTNNNKPPSDDDDTIKDRVENRKSIGQTQLRAYVIRRKYNPRKVTLFKNISLDILDQVCASVL